MTRNLKMLGLALAAMLLLGASAAQGAFAAEEFHADAAPLTVTSKADPTEPTQMFTAAGHTISCNEANFTAQSSVKTTSSLTFVPEVPPGGGAAGFGECEFLGVVVGVTMHECDFVFHGNGKVDVSGNNCKTKAEGGNPIEFEASVLGGLIKCHVEIGSGNNSGLESVTYTNTDTNGETFGKEVTADVNLTGITYTATSVGGGCTAGTNNNGEYVGKETATGETTVAPREMIGVWWQ